MGGEGKVGVASEEDPLWLGVGLLEAAPAPMMMLCSGCSSLPLPVGSATPPLCSAAPPVFQMKVELVNEDSITQEVVGNAHIENYALKMFIYADNEDRAGRFHK